MLRATLLSRRARLRLKKNILLESRFFLKQKTAYEIWLWLEFRRVLFRSILPQLTAFRVRALKKKRCRDRWALSSIDGDATDDEHVEKASPRRCRRIKYRLCGPVQRTRAGADRRRATSDFSRQPDGDHDHEGARP